MPLKSALRKTFLRPIDSTSPGGHGAMMSHSSTAITIRIASDQRGWRSRNRLMPSRPHRPVLRARSPVRCAGSPDFSYAMIGDLMLDHLRGYAELHCQLIDVLPVDHGSGHSCAQAGRRCQELGRKGAIALLPFGVGLSSAAHPIRVKSILRRGRGRSGSAGRRRLDGEKRRPGSRRRFG